MGQKSDCKEDICHCPCHQGKTIDGLGHRVTHGPGKCGCMECGRCKLRIKQSARAGHPGKCPKNPGNDTRITAKRREAAEAKEIDQNDRAGRDSEIILRMPEHKNDEETKVVRRDTKRQRR